MHLKKASGVASWNLRRALVGAILAGLAATGGCSDGYPTRVPVSGVVLIDGKPLTNGRIQFVPADGRTALGVIDQQGQFTLTTFDPNDGCLRGTHHIAVYAFEEIDQTTRRWDAPKRYASVTTSNLTAYIDAPTSNLTIELSWEGVKGPVLERFAPQADE